MRLPLFARILLFTIAPILALSAGAMWVINDRISRNVDSGLAEELARAGKVFDQMVAARKEELELAGNVIVRDPRFFSMLTVPEADRNTDFYNTLADIAREFNELTRQDVFEIFGPDGGRLASAGLKSLAEPVPAGMVARALEGEVTSRMTAKAHEPRQLSAIPVRVGDKVEGVLVLGSTMGAAAAQRLRSMTRSEVTFLTRSGFSVSTHEDRVALHSLVDLRGSRSFGSEPVFSIPVGNDHWVSLVRPMPGSDPSERLFYGLQRSRNRETAFLHRIHSELSKIGLLAALLMVVTGLVVASGITGPIRELVQGAEQMERGNYDFPIRARTRDEVGYLAERFRDLRDHVRRYLSELEAVGRMKSEFLSVASHELRTPITIINGFHSLLHDRILGPLTSQQVEAVEAIGKSVHTLTQIAESATRMSEIDSHQLVVHREPTSMETVLRRAVQSAQRDAPQRKVAVHYERAEEVECSNVDATGLHQAVSNLVRNGIRFTRDGGNVHIRAFPEADTLCITVQDTGVGIAPEDMEKVFERPHTLRDSLGHHSSSTLEFNSAGLGLGLAIARGIVQAHGGTLTLHSVPGLGSTFTIRIPEAVLDPNPLLEEAA